MWFGFGDAKPTLFRVSRAEAVGRLSQQSIGAKGADIINVWVTHVNFRAYVPPHTRKIPSTGDTGLHLRWRSKAKTEQICLLRRPKAQKKRLIFFCDECFTDPQTGVASGVTRSRNVRSRYRCSMCPAIHINSRSWLRSSSTHEPSDPPPRVVFFLCLWSNLVAGNKDTTDWPAVDRRLHHRVVCYGSSS